MGTASQMIFGALLLSIALSVMASQAVPHVEVFALSTIPIVNARDAQVYYLDGIAELEAALSNYLPPNEQQARAITEDRMHRLGPGVQQQLRQTGTGLARALEMKLQRVPAIVFDGKYVVYGVTDVDGARRIYAGARK